MFLKEGVYVYNGLDDSILKAKENKPDYEHTPFNKSVCKIIPFKIRGVEVDIISRKMLKHDKNAEEYEQELLIIPGEPYKRAEPTIIYHGTRYGEHITVWNKGDLHGNSINGLSRQMYGDKPDRKISSK